MMHLRLHLATFIAGGFATLHAAPPAWWIDDGTNSANSTRIIDGGPNAVTNNKGPLNVGQLKNVAVKAKRHLDQALPTAGGAGTGVNAVVNSLHSDPSTNHAVANLGQLKAIAKPFYLRLIAVGYNPNLNLKSHGYPGDWDSLFPWKVSTPKEDNYRPANIGQLKMVFSFSLAGFTPNSDADGDTLPNEWEFLHGLNPFDSQGSQGTAGDPDGDGISNLHEYLYGFDPIHAPVTDTTGNIVGLRVFTPLE